MRHTAARVALTVAIGVLVAMLAFPVLVWAIADPDSPPQVSAVYVFEDLLETGDVGVLVDYYLDYAALPSETVTEAYFVVFVDTDGSTQLKSVAPYAYVDSGYGRGLAWIYFSAAEATAYSLDSAQQANYRIWLVGNPTLSWAGDPPKTIATIDQWNTTGDPAVLLATRVLYYAGVLEGVWSIDLVEATALGNRLTTAGEDYFGNTIANLRTMAPSAYSASEVEPAVEDLDYSTSFGAVATGAIIQGSPVTLSSGSNVITATGTGAFVITLAQGTSGTITNGTGTITSSPSDIVYGDNTITVTGAGTLTVDVALSDLQAALDASVESTGWDLTDLAATFGMSRALLSGIVWVILSVLICGAGFVSVQRGRVVESNESAGKVVMLLFGVCLISGVLLGLLDALPAALLFIGYGAFVGYILFFRQGGDVGKVIMFMGYMWVVVCLAGGILQGTVPQASTELASALSDSDTTITVDSTEGFRTPGVLVIEGERIAYFKTTSTTFEGTFWRPLVRGSGGTEAAAHDAGTAVRMPESSLLNDAIDYNIALLSDASGLMAFVSVPLALFDILITFMVLPLSFVGTDLVILTVIWAIVGIGVVVSLFIALAGGRRV